MLIIAVDFDGVIANGFGEIKGAINSLKFAQTKGHKIILWTCRASRSLVDAVEWCKIRGLIFDAINACVPQSEWFSSPKVHADIFLDDKSFPPFTGWNEFKKYLEALDSK